MLTFIVHAQRRILVEFLYGLFICLSSLPSFPSLFLRLFLSSSSLSQDYHSGPNLSPEEMVRYSARQDDLLSFLRKYPLDQPRSMVRSHSLPIAGYCSLIPHPGAEGNYHSPGWSGRRKFCEKFAPLFPNHFPSMPVRLRQSTSLTSLRNGPRGSCFSGVSQLLLFILSTESGRALAPAC